MPDIPLSAHRAAARLAREYGTATDDEARRAVAGMFWAQDEPDVEESLLSSWWEMREALLEREWVFDGQIARYVCTSCGATSVYVAFARHADDCEADALLARTDPENTEDTDA